MRMTPHAERQAASRGIDKATVLQVLRSKVKGAVDSAAVKLGRMREAVGGLVGSNGDEVWAVVRDGEVVTVMFRRSDQLATPQALRVSQVFA